MWRTVRRVILALIILVVTIPLIATAVLSSDWFRPKLTEICNSFVENGQIGMDSLSVSLLEELPLLSVKLYNGAIHSYAYFVVDQENEKYLAEIPSKAHTPIIFKEIVVSIDIPKLLFGKIDIKRIRIIEPTIYGYISPWGQANWDIFPSDDDEEEESEFNLDLSVGRFALTDASFTLHDGVNKSIYSAGISRLFTGGNISLNMDDLVLRSLIVREGEFSVNMKKGGNWIKLGIDSLHLLKDRSEDIYKIALATQTNVALGGKAYTRGFPFGIDGKIGLDLTNLSNFNIDSTTISIAGSPIVLDGNVGFMGENIFTNLTCNIPGFHLGKAVSYLDTEAFPIFEGMSTDLKIGIDLLLQGRYEGETGLLPAITADIKIPDGSFQYPGIDMVVENLGFDGQLLYDPYVVDSTSIDINSIDLKATGITLKGEGKGVNLLGDPHLKLKFEGDADLTKLSSLFLKESGITAQGDLNIDLHGDFKASDLALTKIGNTKLFGRLQTKNLLVDIPQDSIYAKLEGVSLLFGSLENRRDTTIAIGEKTLQATFRADSADVQYKDIAQVNLSKTRASVKSAADGFSGDTTSIHPLKGSVSAGAIRLATADSTRIRGRGLSLRASMLPSKIDSLVPELALTTSASALAYRDAENFLSIRGAEIDFGGTLRSATRKKMMSDTLAIARRGRYIDSLQLIYPEVGRDSLMAHARKLRSATNIDLLGEEGNIDMSVDASIGDLFEKWDAHLNIKATGGRIITPLFPLRNSLGQVDMAINTNEVKFNNTQVNLGNTDLNLTGRIWGLRRALTAKGKLRGDLLISSDTLDVNQLLQGVEGASAYMASDEEVKEAIAEVDTEEEIAEVVAQAIDTTDMESPLLLIPGNIDFKIGLFVGYGEFANIALNGISGDLYAKNRVLQIDDLRAITDAGDIALTALYSTKSKEELSTGFDLELRNIQVDRLIDIVPSVDTLVPMLRSFEGILDCEMAATAQLDTNMNIILPSLNGVARLQGDDLVLLDGETFAKVARLLRFKDRENNEIDHIAIEMIVKDSKIEMFPFVVQMDRIVAAASGIHNLDMSFNYHLSVIKSPLPIRLGLNVSGTFDDMKFRLGKPQYKSADVPSFTKVIDESRINLRKNLANIFNKGSHDITRIEVIKRDEEMEKALRVQETEELSIEEKKALEVEGISVPAPQVP